MDTLLPVNTIIEANAAIARLADRGGQVTRHNPLFVAGTLACLVGGVLSLMFFSTPLFLMGGGILATVLDVKRRWANDSARWLGQQRRALEGCASDSTRWLGQTRCASAGCVAERTCELRRLMTDLG